MDIEFAQIRTALQTVGHSTLYMQFMRMNCKTESARLLALLRRAVDERDATEAAPEPAPAPRFQLHAIPGGRA